MKILDKIFVSFLITLLAGDLIGQTDASKKDSVLVVSNKNKKSTSSQINQGIHFSINLGATYVKGFGMLTSIAPSFNYQATPRFNMEFGTSVISGMNNYSPSSSVFNTNSNLSQPSNQYFLFGHGQYLLTDKLMLTGSFYKSASPNSGPTNAAFVNYKGLDLGLNYKLSHNITVGAQVRIADGLNTYGQNLYSPFYNPSMPRW